MDPQQCRPFGWKWKGVWVGAETVAMVPAVNVTLSSVSMGFGEITKHPSNNSVERLRAEGISNLLEPVGLNIITDSFTLLQLL